MNDDNYKKYKEAARIGIKGEAFFEALIADFAIPHHIVGPKDVGIDYICEWVHGEKPTGVLFLVQVKTFTVTVENQPRLMDEPTLNGLEKYTIGVSSMDIDDKTLNYWKGFGIPAYLFAVAIKLTDAGSELDCYYKRFTPVLTLDENQRGHPFYKVNRRAKFLAFAQEIEKRLGFARDLYIDLMRWSYFKGSIAYLNPRSLGLMQFGEEERVFQDLFGNYRERVCVTFAKTKQFLEHNCLH